MARHPVLVSIIFIIFVKKILFEVLHFVYHTIDGLEDMIGEVVDAIFRTCAVTLMGPSIDDLDFLPAVMAVQAAHTIGKLLVPVVILYAGAKVGLNLVEKLAVNPVENIREYLVDPIEEYVVKRSTEHVAVLEEYVVVPIGDCVAETIKNYVLVPGYCSLFLIQYIFYLIKKIKNYVLAAIQKYMLAPIQKYGIEIAPIREYVAALIREYVLAPIREYVVAPIQRQFRKLRYKRKIRKVRSQTENLRKIREVVVKAVDAAQKKGEVTLPNVPEWLTSANGITEESMDDVERVVELYFERFEPTDINREAARSVGAIFTNPTFLVIFLFFCLVLILLKRVHFLATWSTRHEQQVICWKEYLMESGCYTKLEKATRLCYNDSGWW